MARLEDLYKRGKTVTLTDDASSAEETIYLKKLSPHEARTAMERANVSRVKYLLAARNPDSSEYLNLLSKAMDKSHESLALEATEHTVARKRLVYEEKVAQKDQWAKDDLLTTLKDSWVSELREIHERGDEDDPKYQTAVDTLAKMQEYIDAVEKETEKARTALMKENMGLSRTELEEIYVKNELENMGDAMWGEAFTRHQLYYAVYEEDQKTRYFESADSINDLEKEVWLPLVQEYRSLEVPVIEGKD